MAGIKNLPARGSQKLMFRWPVWIPRGGSHCSSNGLLVEVTMIRCIDLIGIAGYVILVVSTLLLFPRSAEQMTWPYWLAGLVLWFVACVLLMGWLILRWSVPHSRKGQPPLLVWSTKRSKNKEIAAGVNGKVREKAA